VKIELTQTVQINGLEWGAGSVMDLAPVLAEAYLVRGVAKLIEGERTAVIEADETPERPTVKRARKRGR
jgi:hypothetical protein